MLGGSVTRRLWIGAALLAAAAVFVPAVGATSHDAAPQATPTLYVNYTMNCTFSIVDDSGKPVTAIAPGTYQVMVTTPIMFKLVIPGGPGIDNMAPGDMTGCRGWVQFQLTGPSVNLQTTLDVGCDSNLLLPPTTFKPSSTYVALDNNQPGATREVITTLATGTPVIPSSTPYDATSGKGDIQQSLLASGSVLANLNGSVDSKGLAGLLNRGKAIKTLPPGKYRFTITDKSPKAGFSILGPKSTKVSALTGTGFVGRKTLTLRLGAGRWVFYSNVGKQTTFVVTR
jgi:hypothetical protein